MNSSEYANLDRLDRVHWFYRGKRAIIRHWIDHFRGLRRDDLLIDAGMGAGTWLVEMSGSCRVLGLDDFAESLAIASPRLEAVGGRSMKTNLGSVDLPDECAAVVTMMDVLEHLDDDHAALREMVRLTKPDGLVVITVPAHRWLWSDWDVVLQHRRRYRKQDLLALFSRLPVDVMHCEYFNTTAILPAWLVRTWRRVFPPEPGSVRAEDRVPAAWLNQLLYGLMVGPSRWGWFRPPLGMSILAVLRRRGSAAPSPRSTRTRIDAGSRLS